MEGLFKTESVREGKVDYGGYLKTDADAPDSLQKQDVHKMEKDTCAQKAEPGR
jgi:hypothetical protein